MTGIMFTLGGLRINGNAQVVDLLGRPIPGLYATGEATGGFFYYNYPGGAGLMRGAVFGRRAGTHAAQSIGGRVTRSAVKNKRGKTSRTSANSRRVKP